MEIDQIHQSNFSNLENRKCYDKEKNKFFEKIFKIICEYHHHNKNLELVDGETQITEIMFDIDQIDFQFIIRFIENIIKEVKEKNFYFSNQIKLKKIYLGKFFIL